MKVLVMYDYTRGYGKNLVSESDGKMIECESPKEILLLFMRAMVKERCDNVTVTGYLTECGRPTW
jgi:hypothetical protein